MFFRKSIFTLALLQFMWRLLPALAVESEASAIGESFFRERIAPVLERSCIGCHHGIAARGKLSLDSRSGWLKGGEGGVAVNLNDPAASLILQMVAGPEPEMPKDAPALSPEEAEAISNWVKAALPWPQGIVLQDKREGAAWWSLRPLTSPAVPPHAAKAASDWVRNPLDTFILAKLDEHRLHPAPEAGRDVLIRRLTYDLHGLPPTPEEVQAFVADTDAAAYERLVDRLLASPRYGERWARHWLDVVHFGETHGYDKDKRRDHAWPYRDYVIQSLNDDKPYQQFVSEQLAGDVLYPNQADAIVATGFIAAGPWDFVGHVELREGTVEKAKTRTLDRDDIVASTMSTFNSMTVHCARCHDHAFDPIPQVDHYRLQAVFAGVDRQDVPYDDPDVARRRSELVLMRQTAADSLASVERAIDAIESPELVAVEGQLAQAETLLASVPDPFVDNETTEASPSNGYHSDVSKVADTVKWVQVDLGIPTKIDCIRLIPARPTDFTDAPGFGFPLRFRIEVADDAEFEHAVVVDAHVDADYANPKERPYAVFLAGPTARYVRVTALRLWERTNDFVFALGELRIEADGVDVARPGTVTALDSIEGGRWSKKFLNDGFDSRRRLPDLAIPGVSHAVQARDAIQRQRNQLVARRLELKERLAPAELKEQRLQAMRTVRTLDQQIEPLGEHQSVYAVKSHEPRPIQVLDRGNVEKPGDEALPGGLSCVPELPAVFALTDPTNEGSRRAALAAWLTDARNGLTWRSIVNRVWHYHFGRGLVDTPNDFGRNGSPPTHPELLDWLAVEFRDGGQSLKQLHRLIVTSAAYRQNVHSDPECAERDGGNQYLWRMNRRRLEAEEIRDAVLAVSGKLDLAMGGPSFPLFEFKDDHSPRYDYVPIDKPEVWRRSVYRLITRSVPNPWLEALDCPDPSLSAPVRTTTITALQALVTLNDDLLIRQSQYMAERLQREAAELPRQIDRACWLCFSRGATPAERETLSAYAARHGLANTCRLLLNTNEFLFID